MFEALSARIATTPASVLISDVQWITPVVQSVHIAGIAVVMGSALMLDLRLLGLAARTQPVEVVARRFAPWIWGAIIVLAASGSVLIVGEPARELLNPVFRAKMVMVVLAALVTLAADIGARRAPAGLAPRLAGAASLALWVAVIAAGRWIAYTQAD